MADGSVRQINGTNSLPRVGQSLRLVDTIIRDGAWSAAKQVRVDDPAAGELDYKL